MKLLWPAVVLLVLAPRAWAGAEVTVFVERFGSDDVGATLFLERVGVVVVEDFDDRDRFDLGTRVPVLELGAVKLSLESDWNGPYVPEIYRSTEYEFEDRFFDQGLIGGVTLRLIADRGQVPRALGMWVFDDNHALDSAYLIEVLECDGTAWAWVLENEIGMNEYGHELEGFVGVVSDVGIARMTITAIDPVTGEPNGDLFEIDNVVVGEFDHPRRCRNMFRRPPGRPDEIPPDPRGPPAGRDPRAAPSYPASHAASTGT